MISELILALQIGVVQIPCEVGDRRLWNNGSYTRIFEDQGSPIVTAFHVPSHQNPCWEGDSWEQMYTERRDYLIIFDGNNQRMENCVNTYEGEPIGYEGYVFDTMEKQPQNRVDIDEPVVERQYGVATSEYTGFQTGYVRPGYSGGRVYSLIDNRTVGIISGTSYPPSVTQEELSTTAISNTVIFVPIEEVCYGKTREQHRVSFQQRGPSLYENWGKLVHSKVHLLSGTG